VRHRACLGANDIQIGKCNDPYCDGIAGCGKSTIGRQPTDRLGWPFYDGDDSHPAANVEKTSQGQPLTDEDRSGWLNALADLISVHVRQSQSAVIACSALKQKYRARRHYMPPGLPASQFAALEEPQGVLTFDIRQPPEQIVAAIVRQL
jgi:gluconate kinase